ncbi:MAG: DUF432 domain-containing protein [Thermoprotei archaeon]
MSNGFGFFMQEARIGEYHVVCGKQGQSIVYTRFKNDVIETSKILDQALKFELVPLYPVFTPFTFTKYILLELTTPVIVSGNSHIEIYAVIPIDGGVYAYYNNGFSLIDAFPLNKVKYALYGPVEEGVVARYYKSAPYTDMRSPNLGEALTKIRIVNKISEGIEVSKILLDSRLLKLYYKPQTNEAYTQEVVMNIIGKNKAIITYGSPFVEDLTEINDPPGFKPPRLKGANEMLWGFK